MHSMGMYKNCQHFHHYQKSKYKVFVCVRRVAMVATQPSNPTDSPLTGLLQKAPPLRRRLPQHFPADVTKEARWTACIYA